MARHPRIQIDGGLYHVTTRAVAGAALYRDDFDRETFLWLLDGAVRRFEWVCQAFCLMTNHFHLLLETRVANIARGMQWLNSAYACGFNKRHARPGHVVQGRYGSRVIGDEAYLLEVARYVVLNPVRAHICTTADEWRWSSYRATAGLELPPRLLAVKPLLTQFGGRLGDAQASYERFVAEGSPAASLDGLLALPPTRPALRARTRRLRAGGA